MKIFSWLLFPSSVLLFWIFLKIGLIFFGGGYVVIPAMHRELVTNMHWLSDQEFIDGTAISQLTPGPIAILATFAGYKIAGIVGALIATFAVFLPGSLLMLFLSSSYEKFKDLTLTRKILDTFIPVIVGLLIAASGQIGATAITNFWGLFIFCISFVALIRFKVNPALLIIITAFLGFFFHS